MMHLLLLADSFIIRAVNMVSNLDTKQIWRVFAVQGIITTVLTVVLYYSRSANDAASACLGGLAAIVPAMSFAKVLFRHQGARLAKKIVNDFYRGECIKIVFAIGLFAVIFRFYQVSPLVFFIIYSSMTMSFGFLLLIFSRWFRRGF